MLDCTNYADSLILFWYKLGWPLLRLLLSMSAGLFVAGFIESMNWTSRLASVAAPLVKFGHLSDVAGAAFSVSFVSGMTANAMLSEAYEKKVLSRQELVLANLFNSLPTYFLHLPTTFLLAASLIKEAAVVYMVLTLSAAVLRSTTIIVVSRAFLPPAKELLAEDEKMQLKKARTNWKTAWQRTAKKFRRRILKIAYLTVPIYVLFFLLAKTGVFRILENFLAIHLSFFAWLSPKAISIIGLQMASEFTGGMAVAGALLQDGMDSRQIVLALLIGNVLSSPVRAIRHQFPYYAGIFRPRLALLLIASNQGFRATSLALVAVLYFVIAL